MDELSVSVWESRVDRERECVNERETAGGELLPPAARRDRRHNNKLKITLYCTVHYFPFYHLLLLMKMSSIGVDGCCCSRCCCVADG